jgi:hypothetical protein
MPQRFVALLGLLLLVSLAATARAQTTLRGTVVDSATQLGLPGAVVTATDSADRPLGRTITNGHGAFVLRAASFPGRLDVIRIGYKPRRMAPLPDQTLRVVMVSVAQQLTAMKVSDRALCPGSAAGESTLQLWEQARAGLLVSIVAREANPASVRGILYERELDERDSLIRRQTERIHAGQSTRPFLAPSPERLAREGYMRVEGSERRYFAPDADVLFDSSFASSHCLQIERPDAAHAGEIGLAFAPQKDRGAPVDVSGVIWIQASHPEVRSIDYRYTGLEPAMPDAGGHLDFVTPPNGASFIDRWFIRIPILAPVTSGTATFNGDRVMRSRSAEYRATGFYVAGGLIVSARWNDSSAWQAPRTGISGIVVDHQSGSPVAHALVTFAGTADTLVTDSLGRFAKQEMLPGTYEMITSDTSLVALGRDRSDRRPVTVKRGEVLEQRIPLPAIQESIAQICEKPQSQANPAMLVGRIGFPSPTPARSARVHISWRPDDGRLAAMHLGELTREAEVDQRGRFVVCALPMDQRLDLHLSFTGGQADTSMVIHRTYVGSIDWRLPAPTPGTSPR